jgi:hypothetical protein
LFIDLTDLFPSFSTHLRCQFLEFPYRHFAFRRSDHARHGIAFSSLPGIAFSSLPGIAGGLRYLIIDYRNIRLAFLKTLRGKCSAAEVLLFCRHVDAHLHEIRTRLLAESVRWGEYHHFTIRDPKKRTISAAPFEDRVIHHAIMNVLEPLFERQMIYHSYACRKGKGTCIFPGWIIISWNNLDPPAMPGTWTILYFGAIPGRNCAMP